MNQYKNLILLTDIGSTYTKVTLIDLEQEVVLGKDMSATTVDTDAKIGMETAIRKLEEEMHIGLSNITNIKSSSAAGGLKIVALGLVPELTLKAAEMAALGAGAKIVGAFGYGLNDNEINQIGNLKPDIILLTGGTNGGNEEVVLKNSSSLAKLNIKCPYIYAGNKSVSDKVKSIFVNKGKEVIITENVLPKLDVLNVQPVRKCIRELFIQNIIKAKGLDVIKDILMPTPVAVMEAAKLLSEGSNDKPGLGDLMVIDIGGATTDVHSIAPWVPGETNVVLSGLPEPYCNRTVEGDLGVRINADSILNIGMEKSEAHIVENKEKYFSYVSRLKNENWVLPVDQSEHLMDYNLAKIAIKKALERHCGFWKEVYYPGGKVIFQHGKDLRKVKFIIGTGGIFVKNKYMKDNIKQLLKPNLPHLTPINSTIYFDNQYLLYAIGLLSGYNKKTALNIMLKNLTIGLHEIKSL